MLDQRILDCCGPHESHIDPGKYGAAVWGLLQRAERQCRRPNRNQPSAGDCTWELGRRQTSCSVLCEVMMLIQRANLDVAREPRSLPGRPRVPPLNRRTLLLASGQSHPAHTINKDV